MNKILLVCAMNEELDAFKSVLVKNKIKHTFKNNLIRFNLNKKEIYVSTIGITFFNIAKLTKLINSIKPNEIISFGTCAGLGKQKIGDVIVSNNVKCADLDLTNFGYLDGTTNKKKDRVKGPLMISGSHFLSSKKEKENIKKRFKGASTFDMETYMIYCVAKEYNIPYVSMKAISDNGEKDPSSSFEKNLVKATISSSKSVFSYIKHNI